MEETPNINQKPNQFEPPKAMKSNNRKFSFMFTVALLVLSLAGNAYMYWQYQAESDSNNKSTKQVQDLKKQLEDLNAKKSSEESTEQQTTETKTDTKFEISDSLKENIKASFDTMNTQPLESYMADTVKVILAASEGIGDRTPAQAVSDLDYFKDATTPWDFDLPASVLSSYGSNEYYGQYFGENTLVGKAVSKQIVSMHFNSDGKIDVIFMMVSEDLF